MWAVLCRHVLQRYLARGDTVVDLGAGQTAGSPVSAVETVAVSLSPALLTEPKLFIKISAE